MKEPLFACLFCSTVYASPACLEDGSDIVCRRCGGSPGEVEPVEESDELAVSDEQRRTGAI